MHRQSRVVIHVKPFGNLGNQMLQYMAALKLSDYVPNSVVTGIRMDDWGIDTPDIAQTSPKTLRYRSQVTERLNFPDIASRVSRGRYERVELDLASSHVENLPPLEQARKLFQIKHDVEGYGENVLVINIRGAEILQAVHPHYTVLPILFYKDVISKTGLSPVFLGQLDQSNEYTTHLMSSFPGCKFVSSKNAHHDFSVLAKSKNIVVAISTFSWLAAWLSHADRVILPLSGFCNPLQYPKVDLMPRGDNRFEYYLFPKNYAVLDSEILAAHEQISGQWRPVTYEAVQAIRTRSPFLSPDSRYLRFSAKAKGWLRRHGFASKPNERKNS